MISAPVSGSGPDLVLLHSLLTDRRVWALVTPDLARRYRVWEVDLPGWGRTPQVAADIGDYADRVAEFLDAHQLSAGTSVVGNGLGAMVALALGVRHGQRFDRLVLAGAAAHFPDAAATAFASMAERVRRGGMAAVVDTAITRIFAEDYLLAHPAVREERRQVLLHVDPAAFVTACDALRRMDLRADLGGIANPTLIIVGDRDAATPPDRARELAAGIPHAQLVVLPGCAHAPQLQDPEAFVAALDRFLVGT